MRAPRERSPAGRPSANTLLINLVGNQVIYRRPVWRGGKVQSGRRLLAEAKAAS